MRKFIANYKYLFVAFCAAFVLLVNSETAFPQFYKGSQLTFGKNRVQWWENFWTYYKFNAFDVYFYTGGKNLAIFTGKYASENLKDVERKLDYNLENKIQFVVFNSLSDLKQSNIGLISDEQYNVGGITHIVGSKVFIYNDGNREHLKKQIKSGIANVIVNEMLYGEQIAAKIKNSTLLTLPDWYIKGLVSYVSEEWSVEQDNYVRDGIMSGNYEKFNQLTGTDAVYAGHSIWNYISQKYGDNIIPNILYMTKISKNVESGFLFVLGISFKNFAREWIDYYDKMYFKEEQELLLPEQNKLFKNKNEKKVFTNAALSPDGKTLAYVTNEIGKTKVFLYDTESKKSKLLMKSGQKLDEKTDYSFPLVAWHPAGKRLAVITESKGKIFLYYYNTDEKTFEKQRLFDFQKILSFSYSQNGKLLVMSAVINGQTDIFVYNFASHTYEAITKDPYDDFNPVFMDDSKLIVFSSNRLNDTLKTGNKDSIDFVTGSSMDLFLYNYSAKKKVLRRITNTPNWNESQPQVYKTNYLGFLSDRNGIVNRDVVKLDSAISYIDTTTHYKYLSYINPQTNYKRNIITYSLCPLSEKSTEIIYDNGLYNVYLNSAGSTDSLSSNLIKNTLFVSQKQSQVLAKKVVSEKNRTIELNKDTLKPKQKRLSVVMSNDTIRKDKIDINNYSFTTEAKNNPKSNQDTVKIAAADTSKKKEEKPGFVLPRQRNFDVEYTINQLVNQADFSFLNASYQAYTASDAPIYINPGFNALLKVGVTDLLEDYRLTGGVSFSLNLSGTDYLLSFENLKKRLDKQIVFYRQNMESDEVNAFVRHSTNELQYILKWPFSPVLALKGTGLIRNDRAVYLATDHHNLQVPNVYNTWGGLKAELIFDNTRDKGLNLYFGTRYKLFAEVYRKVDENKLLNVVGIDYRHYAQISRTFIWANRFAASTSFGNQKLIYYMGGVDNWLFPQFDSKTNVAKDQNYAYQTIATNMRGFKQNVRNGNSFAVINSELRFPFFRYLMNRPLKSEFFNNFQIVGFGDLGTAWTGSNPYSDKNALYTDIVTSGPITVTLKTEKEPIVGGFGFGARTKLLGYFVRADWAWGVEDGTIHKNVFYISMSLDF
jgi:WD40 repeat protein